MVDSILVNTRDKFTPTIEKLVNSPLLGWDTESSGPLLLYKKKNSEFINMYRSQLTGMSFFNGQEAFYFPFNHRRDNLPVDLQQKLLKLVKDREDKIVAHNAKHELIASGMPDLRIHCSQVGMFLLQKDAGGKYGLKALALSYLNMQMASFEETSKLGEHTVNFCELPPELGLQYACDDAIAAYRLWDEHIEEDLLADQKLYKWYRDVELPTIRVLRHMTDSGMEISSKIVNTYVDEFSTEINDLMEEWDTIAPSGVDNPRSWKQLQKLYESGIWHTDDILKTKSGAYSIESEEVAKQLIEGANPLGMALAELKMRISVLSKLTSTYGHKMVEIARQYPDLRMHADFNHTGTATGRYSSSYQNLQNIPTRTEDGKRVREAFVPSPGHVLISADYSQIELRVLAHYCGKGLLFDAYMANEDVHQRTADAIGTDRSTGKTQNFAVIYGAGDKKLAKKARIPLSKQRELSRQYKQAMPDVFKTQERNLRTAYMSGKARTLGGRYRDVANLSELRERKQSLAGQGLNWRNSSKFREACLELGRVERRAKNAPIQGSAADIVKLGMLSFYSAKSKDWKIVGQVHDEVLVEVPIEEADSCSEILKECLENAYELKVPLIAEPSVGNNWGELK